ncbi:MAG: HlyD family efflux transporter periplasmic adaptor subunit [Cyanobacteria bacterium J06638_22]
MLKRKLSKRKKSKKSSKPDNLPALRPVKAEDYVPPVSHWMMWSGFVLVGSLGVGILLASVVRYNVTVRASASIRPSGEVRLVQAELDGTIERIDVAPNQTVQRGEAIAYLDASRLETQRDQLQNTLRQTQQQLIQMNAQIQFLEAQIAAEGRSRDQALSVAQAELRRGEQELAERQATAQADLAEAEATLEFAQTEMQRYAQLVGSGAISQLQFEEKQAAVRTAEAQLARAQAALNPTNASVAIAQEQIGQQAATGAATLANLSREREALVQLRVQLQAQLLQQQTELQRAEADLAKTVIRATSDGVILQLTLRNVDQIVRSGDTVAEIAPDQARLVIKAQVNPQFIQRVEVGQVAQMRVSACPYPDYGVLTGEVTAVSPDVITTSSDTPNASPPQSSYYEVSIQPNVPALVRGDRTCPLQSGMQAEASIVSRTETPMMFLLRRARLWANL